MPYKGARLATPGANSTTHEGIFGGLDRNGVPFVIENSKQYGSVRVSTLQEFSGGGECWVVGLPPAGQADEIVRRALSFIGREYILERYNCQHFVSEVYTGYARSWELAERGYMPEVFNLLGLGRPGE